MTFLINSLLLQGMQEDLLEFVHYCNNAPVNSYLRLNTQMV